jgi:hypothetical protein
MGAKEKVRRKKEEVRPGRGQKKGNTLIFRLRV